MVDTRVVKLNGCEYAVYENDHNVLLGTVLAHEVSGLCAAARADGQPAHDVMRRRIWTLTPLVAGYVRLTPPNYTPDFADSDINDFPIEPVIVMTVA